MTLLSLRDLMAEKATDHLLHPVASFRGVGEKDALQLSGECLEMNLWRALVLFCPMLYI